jgi:hypothetical protein
LAATVQIEQREKAVCAKHAQQDGVREEYLGRDADPHGGFRWWIR